MGSKYIVLAFSALLLLPVHAHGTDTVITDDQITIKKLRTHDDVIRQYCYVETGVSGDCEYHGSEDKLDVVYVPKSFGDRVLAQIQSAYSKKYYQNVSKVDLFHGHFLAKGPQTEYASAAAWFNDVQMILYHSAEYLHEVWKDLEPGDPVYEEHPVERSFAGWTHGDNAEVVAAISLILPGSLLKSYASAGTVYAEELNDSIHVSEHKLSTFGGNAAWYLQNSCGPGDAKCKPCEIFNMMYIMEDLNGRFVTPDGKRVEFFFHCKFKN